MTYNPDLDDRYGVRGNGKDGHGYVIVDFRENVFVRVHMLRTILILATRRQAEALAEVMNLEDTKRREAEEIAEHVEFPNGR